ncbi:MAG: 50S ribosomal protein L28 [Defluviitaleaceae bacterium]|nr:50S ribosomal protein L28 [Defluviitaleaceae bacterium]
MAARCDISGKGVMTGHRISITRSHVSRRANRTWKPNLKKIRVMDENGSIKTMKICVKELRNLKKSKKFSRVI